LYYGNKIGRITPTGVITEFPLPGPGFGSGASGITAGPDGNLWFAETTIGKIGRITPDGAITEFGIPGGQRAIDITAGPDRNLWFTQFDNDRIGRMTTTGIFSAYRVHTEGSSPWGIAPGPDGNVWFTEIWGSQIGVIRPSSTGPHDPLRP